MSIYGLPLLGVEGIFEWADLATPGNARRMGDAMQSRMGRGDTAVNLAATSLAVNAWLYGHDDELASWVMDYVGAWRERAAANGGLLPDNVGPSGVVGELHDGAWYGGHYGWTWPHGLWAVGAGRAGVGDERADRHRRADALDLARVPLDTAVSEGRIADALRLRSLGQAGLEKLQVAEAATPRGGAVPARAGRLVRLASAAALRAALDHGG